ncbi:MAG: GH92 family glycosyl hydrolase [Chitinophagaceae bacterium]|nr:GH92 family glycosyl hydrolase [Chitinophagaceae bacterium]
MKLFSLFISCMMGLVPAFAQDFTKYVNPFIGTANEGNTHPGPVLPWGMMSLSPFNSYDTVKGTTGASPYYHDRTYISGFTHLNMSGVGCGDMGIACIMPTTGTLTLHQPRNCSEYENETALPGFYSVNLTRFNTKAELTATERTGLSRFTFPEGLSNILINLGIGLSQTKGGVIKKVSPTEFEGFKSLGNLCGLAGKQVVYFVVKISRQPVRSGVWSQGLYYDNFEREIAGNDIGAYACFETGDQEQVMVQVAVSFVSVANARLNLQKEQPGIDFERVKENAVAKWKKELSVIQVEGGTEDDRIKFYTALYHVLIHPSVFNDVNGESPAMEGDRIVRADGFNRYTIFSLWDTYRNLHPFLSLVYPKQQSDMIKSLLAMYREWGWLPRWELAGTESNCMTGDPVIPVIADSYLRGIRDFDVPLAWEAVMHNSMPAPDNTARPGLDDWTRMGYIPDDAVYTLKVFTSNDISQAYTYSRKLKTVWGSVSTALEYCIADWNAAQMAGALGKTGEQQMFYKRAMQYRNNFDTATGFMRPRLKDGSWHVPFDPASKRLDGFVEGSSWNYTYMVPHDIPGMIRLSGGNKKFLQQLNRCFSEDHFDITNEPDLAYPYLFNYIPGEEWRTQAAVTKIVKEKFSNAPAGLPGNDDCGTMSAWLLFSMMGFYPDCPGNMQYQLTTPAFNKVTIQLDPSYYRGNIFVIEASGNTATDSRVSFLTLNNKRYKGFSIQHKDIIAGGTLRYVLKKP